ncbi:MAG: hypothetical protein ACE5HS_01375 [bacterium]
MFAKRNSVTLGILWVLLLIIGGFWYFKDAGKLVKAIEKERKYAKLLKMSQNEIKRLTDVENIHQELNSKWTQAPKIIISADEPSFTLSYINWIMTSNNLVIDFDFVLNGKSESDNYTKFIYTLNGEASYNNIYKLIWFLTYEPILYKINSLTLKQSDSSAELLKFSIQLQGYTVDSESEFDEELTDLSPRNAYKFLAQKNIFKPLVSKPAPKKVVQNKPQLPKKLPGQIDVEKASLKVVTNNSIFISEGNSELKQLKVGDAVYLGTLVRIDQNSNTAEFLISKFGKSKRIVLTIDERK